MKQSVFRNFCIEMWYRHKDELLEWEKQLPQYDSNYYFLKHRWFLKNLFKKEVDNKRK